MATYSFFFEGKFIGEYHHYFDHIHYAIYCQWCGEVFARRISSIPDSVFNFTPGVCRGCISRHPPHQFPTLRLPIEQIEGFAPVEILALEFTLAYDAYFAKILKVATKEPSV